MHRGAALWFLLSAALWFLLAAALWFLLAAALWFLLAAALWSLPAPCVVGGCWRGGGGVITTDGAPVFVCTGM